MNTFTTNEPTPNTLVLVHPKKEDSPVSPDSIIFTFSFDTEYDEFTVKVYKESVTEVPYKE